MSNLWVTATRPYRRLPDEQSEQARRERVDQFLQRQDPRAGMPIRNKWSPHKDIGSIYSFAGGGIGDDEHWEHLPLESVSLRQPVWTHQGHVSAEVVRAKLHEGEQDDNDPEPWEEDPDPGGHDPKFVRHEGRHYLLDGHHRLVKARLMGEDSMLGRVYDTSRPEDREDNCYQCHENESYGQDHVSEACRKCRTHGWSM